MTVGELRELIKDIPDDTEVRRVVTAGYGVTDVECVRYDPAKEVLIID